MSSLGNYLQGSRQTGNSNMAHIVLGVSEHFAVYVDGQGHVGAEADLPALAHRDMARMNVGAFNSLLQHT